MMILASDLMEIILQSGKVETYHNPSKLPMKLSELEEIINLAERDRLVGLVLENCKITELSKSIGKLKDLRFLSLCNNELADLPSSIFELTNLRILNLSCNQLTDIKGIEKLKNLDRLFLNNNCLRGLPDEITRLHISQLGLQNNQLKTLPNFQGSNFGFWYLSDEFNINDNPLIDSSNLRGLPIPHVKFLGCDLGERYWTKLSEWKAVWLLDERNAEIRRLLIEQIGYEKICRDLNTTTIDSWREYTLLKIDNTEITYEEYTHWSQENLYTFHLEPIVLLKMTCPSTKHIHILRVPPEMTSAQAAITWVNHGIHPDFIAFQT